MSLVRRGGGESLMEATLSMMEGGRGGELLTEASSSLVRRQVCCFFCLLHHRDPVGLSRHTSNSALPPGVRQQVCVLLAASQ